jgi:hypothetical protein
MSDEQRKDEEAEVEAHNKHYGHDEPTEETETEDEVEAHVRHSSPRSASPRNS